MVVGEIVVDGLVVAGAVAMVGAVVGVGAREVVVEGAGSVLEGLWVVGGAVATGGTVSSTASGWPEGPED